MIVSLSKGVLIIHDMTELTNSITHQKLFTDTFSVLSEGHVEL